MSETQPFMFPPLKQDALEVPITNSPQAYGIRTRDVYQDAYGVVHDATPEGNYTGVAADTANIFAELVTWFHVLPMKGLTYGAQSHADDAFDARYELGRFASMFQDWADPSELAMSALNTTFDALSYVLSDTWIGNRLDKETLAFFNGDGAQAYEAWHPYTSTTLNVSPYHNAFSSEIVKPKTSLVGMKKVSGIASQSQWNGYTQATNRIKIYEALGNDGPSYRHYLRTVWGILQPWIGYTDGEMEHLLRSTAYRYNVDARMLAGIVYGESRVTSTGPNKSGTSSAIGIGQMTAAWWADLQRRVKPSNRMPHIMAYDSAYALSALGAVLSRYIHSPQLTGDIPEAADNGSISNILAALELNVIPEGVEKFCRRYAGTEKGGARKFQAVTDAMKCPQLVISQGAWLANFRAHMQNERNSRR